MNDNPDIILDTFSIVGISVQTTNQNGKSQTDIGQLWQKFTQENLVEKIPNKDSTEIYCIYTDYESDFNGPYTTIIGCRVTDFTNAPDGFMTKIINKGRYLKILSKGKLPECVAESWKSIWQSQIDRAYIADFDFYGKGCENPQNATVDIYLSIK